MEHLKPLQAIAHCALGFGGLIFFLLGTSLFTRLSLNCSLHNYEHHSKRCSVNAEKPRCHEAEWQAKPWIVHHWATQLCMQTFTATTRQTNMHSFGLWEETHRGT